MYVQTAMAVASMISASKQKAAQMKAAANDMALQRAKLERASIRAAGDFATNTQRMREAAQSREIQIESERLSAESRMAETFAGSGISGTSIDELDAELNAAVDKNKYENKIALDQQLSDTAQSYMQGGEDLSSQAAAFAAPKKDTFGSVLDSVTTGIQGFAAGQQFASGLKESGFDVNKSIGSFFSSTPSQTLSIGNYSKFGSNITK